MIVNVEQGEVYSAIGEDGFHRLVSAFYRQVPSDDILGPMYPPEDMDGAEERLRGFLIFRFGGPPDYLTQRGHPRLRMRHAPFVIDAGARDRWLKLMRNALDEAAIPSEPRAVLDAFFASTAEMMINRHSQA